MLQNHCEATQLYLSHDLTLSQLAATIGTNRTYLSSYFSQQGDTYNVYINRLRIEHFIQLYHEALSQSHPVTALELSQQCGYRTYRTFSTAFRQHMGITVTAWMQSERSVLQHARQEMFAKNGRIHKNCGRIYKTLTLPPVLSFEVAEDFVTLQTLSKLR